MKSYSIILLLLAFLFINNKANAQKVVAETHYKHYSYQDAIAEYKKILRTDRHNGEALYNMANAYRLNGKTVEAEQWFAKAVIYNPEPLAKLYYAQALMSNKKYKQARQWFENYKNVAEDQNNIRMAENMAAFCKQLEENGLPESDFEVKLVPFNSQKFDYSPTIFSDSAIVFVSNRNYKQPKDKKKKDNQLKRTKQDRWTGDQYMKLFIARSLTNDAFAEPDVFFKEINSIYHEGPAVFHRNGKVMYFTKNDVEDKKKGFDEERNNRLAIFESKNENGKWTTPTKISISKSEYTVCHPALANDGSFMIFASDMPGGFGGMDLYISYAYADEWGVAENLGEQFNTVGNEVFPYLDKNNNLFFSSTMHVGFGGLDVFKSISVGDKKWAQPENFGVPINSPKDDFGFTVTNDWRKGYFSSNRSGNDEIYSFLANEKMITGSYGGNHNNNGRNGNNNGGSTTIVKKNYGKNKLEICGEVINSKYKNSLKDAKVDVLSKCTGEELKFITPDDGTFRFVADKNCEYMMVAQKDKFRDTLLFVSTIDIKPDSSCMQVLIPLTFDEGNLGGGFTSTNSNEYKKGDIIELENIYFDLDKYNIRFDAVEDLNNLYRLMVKYPNMTGEIGAHTDSRASFAYNIVLSNNRAKSAVRYLVNMGISRDRLTWRGYGETQLKNGCADGVECTEKQHQRNRRIEFKVTYFDGVLVSREADRYK